MSELPSQPPIFDDLGASLQRLSEKIALIQDAVRN